MLGRVFPVFSSCRSVFAALFADPKSARLRTGFCGRRKVERFGSKSPLPTDGRMRVKVSETAKGSAAHRTGFLNRYLLMAKGTQNQPQVAFRGAAVWRCGNGRLTRVCKQTGPVSYRPACAASSFREKQSAADTKRRG